MNEEILALFIHLCKYFTILTKNLELSLSDFSLSLELFVTSPIVLYLYNLSLEKVTINMKVLKSSREWFSSGSLDGAEIFGRIMNE
jgi:hypothetical protein